MWKELQKVMNPRQNYLAYREVLKTAPAPVFPYFGRAHRPAHGGRAPGSVAEGYLPFARRVRGPPGIFLSDLTMIHEKFPTFIGRGNLINFSKIRCGARRRGLGPIGHSFAHGGCPVRQGVRCAGPQDDLGGHAGHAAAAGSGAVPDPGELAAAPVRALRH